MTVRPNRYRYGIIPHIYVDGASDAIAFYERAFGAEECSVSRAPTAKSCMRRSRSALLRRAVEAGAEEIQRATDMFYGASSASARDPFGHVWVLLSWKEDLEPAEIERRGNDLLADK